MIDLGANPYIRNAAGKTQFDVCSVSNLKNVPSIRSVFYATKNFQPGNLGEPFCYTTGVYDGKLGRVLGKGGEGKVIRGEWNGQQAAYKFVQIKREKQADNYSQVMEDMNERLKEMTEMMATPGDAILPFIAHYR